jgi:hypothetical protein
MAAANSGSVGRGKELTSISFAESYPKVKQYPKGVTHSFGVVAISFALFGFFMFSWSFDWKGYKGVFDALF